MYRRWEKQKDELGQLRMCILLVWPFRFEKTLLILLTGLLHSLAFLGCAHAYINFLSVFSLNLLLF